MTCPVSMCDYEGMQRLTFVADDHLADRIRREAHIRRISVSEVIRETLVEGFEANSGQDRFPFIGIFESDGTSSAAQLDEYLEENWARDIMRHRG